MHSSAKLHLKSLICILFINAFLFSGVTVDAQNVVLESSAEAYQIALGQSLIAQNRDQFIPIQRLDSTTFTLLNYGLDERLIKTALLRYIDESSLHIQTEDHRPYQTGLIFLYKSSYQPSEIKRIKKMLLNLNCIVVISSADMFVPIPDLTNAKSIIYLDQGQALNIEILVQQVFGGAPINTISFDQSNDKQDDETVNGLDGQSRLGFAPGEVVGMDIEMLSEGINRIALEGIDSMAYPGCQVLVAKSGKVIFHRTYGHHTYDKKRPVQADDLYDLASITKISSATTALMKLHGEGQFDLESTLGQTIPRYSKTNKGQLTWRRILAHHARLKPWIPYWTTTLKKNGKFKARTLKRKPHKRYPIQLTDQLFLHRKYKEKRIFKQIARSPLNTEPGYRYSGLSFYLIPDMVSEITGYGFEDYLKQKIYHPIGAFSITYNPLRYYTLDEIVPTENDTFFRKTQLHGVVHDEGAAMMNGVSGNAGLFAKILDLAKLMQLFLNEGSYGDDQIISTESVREFTRCQYCEEGNRRGLGFERPMIEYAPDKSHVSKYVSDLSFGHSGYTGTLTWVDPEYDLIFIFFSNRVYPTRLNRKLYTMNIRPRMQDVIYESMIDFPKGR